MPCSFSYPTAFPIDCIQELIGIIRAQSFQAELPRLVHSVWTIQGYAQALLIGAPSPVINGLPPISDQQRRDLIELYDLLAVRTHMVTGPLEDQLLDALRAYLLPLLKLLLAKWLGL
jgi:hypothetical protein